MSRVKGYSSLTAQVERLAKEIALEYDDLNALQDYEEHYTRVCESLKVLARYTAATWEPAYNELRLRLDNVSGDDDALEHLEAFLLRSKSALTEYRRKKRLGAVAYRKPPVNVKQYVPKGMVRDRMEEHVKSLQFRMSELVEEANREALATLDYLIDIHAEVKREYETLQRKVKRSSNAILLEDENDPLWALHMRLTHAGKVRMSHGEFARLLRDGYGSFTFIGKQNELAYLLLFLSRNGLVQNWKGLKLFYEQKGVPTPTLAKGIIEAQKKIGARNDPPIKALLAELVKDFPKLSMV